MDLLQRAAAAPFEDARPLLASAVRASSDQIWVARNAARLYATHVGDVAAAREVIANMSPLTCLEWRLVAAAYCELDDREAAGRCLERAANNARVPVDLCHVAMGYRDAGYEDEARLLVDGAARVASHSIDCWIVANCYRDSFGEPTRAREVLVAGLRDAVGVVEKLGFVRAFAAHDAETDELSAIVARAKATASTVHDFIELSVAHHLILLDAEAAEQCVDQASRLSTSPQDERAVAVARGRLHLHVLDDERPKLPPSKLLATGARSYAWDRDANRLLGWLRARISRASINTLARPNQFFANDDMITLLDLQKTGYIPHPLPAFLDVLRETARRTQNVDHQLRAFACAVVCIDDAAAVISEDPVPTMALLLESCLHLGADAMVGAASLFAALADAYEATRSTTKDYRYVYYAELGLALAAAWLDPTDPRIPPLVDRMFAEPEPWEAARSDPQWRALAFSTLLHPKAAALFDRF